jgi:nitrogen regulatory protein P-II 2
MKTFPKKLLVIITEASLENVLAEKVKAMGAHGYTVHYVHGMGSTGAREGTWDADRTIEMKVICDAVIADQIAEKILAEYGANYALTLFLADVEVFRGAKY